MKAFQTPPIQYKGSLKYAGPVTLHRLGLLHIPQYYTTDWKDRLHLWYCRGVYSFVLLVYTPLLLFSTFFYAIHSMPEFLIRIFETMTLITYLGLFYNIYVKADVFVQLYVLSEDIDSKVSSKKIQREVNLRIFIIRQVVLIAAFGVFAAIVLFSCLPVTDREGDILKRIYHLKPPYRKLPWMVRLPFVYAYTWPFYGVFYCVQIMILILILICYYQAAIWITSLIEPLIGNYRMLSRFVRMIGRDHTNTKGERIFYTNIEVGTFVTESELLQMTRKYSPTQKNPIPKLMKNYERTFVRQIILRHQELISFKHQFQTMAADVINKILMGPAFFLIIIAFYQLVYMKNLTFGEQLKFIIDLFAIGVTEINYVHTSERLDFCTQEFCGAVYQSQWYRLDPDLRKAMILMIQKSQASNHLTFLYGLAKMRYSLFVYWLKFSYTFINVMKLNGLI